MLKEELLIVEDLWKFIDGKPVLKGITFDVSRGETKVILGPSGAGKSTLLRCINLLIMPDRGRIIFDGEDVLKRRDVHNVRSKMGFVFQHFNLFSHMTALENVMLGLVKVKKMPKHEAEKKAKEALMAVGITEELWNRYPAQLSGGQQQRVAIARALAMEPKLILFDEPTSALDPELIWEVLNVMERLAKAKMTMIVVTHEIGFAMRVASEVMFLDDGMILERGPPEQVILNPRNERVKRFMDRMKYVYSLDTGRTL
jgi:polar amino acid transport system ATP-binding protein